MFAAAAAILEVDSRDIRDDKRKIRELDDTRRDVAVNVRNMDTIYKTIIKYFFIITEQQKKRDFCCTREKNFFFLDRLIITFYKQNE